MCSSYVRMQGWLPCCLLIIIPRLQPVYQDVCNVVACNVWKISIGAGQKVQMAAWRPIKIQLYAKGDTLTLMQPITIMSQRTRSQQMGLSQ